MKNKVINFIIFVNFGMIVAFSFLYVKERFYLKLAQEISSNNSTVRIYEEGSKIIDFEDVQFSIEISEDPVSLEKFNATSDIHALAYFLVDIYVSGKKVTTVDGIKDSKDFVPSIYIGNFDFDDGREILLRGFLTDEFDLIDFGKNFDSYSFSKLSTSKVVSKIYQLNGGLFPFFETTLYFGLMIFSSIIFITLHVAKRKLQKIKI
ncbi:MAG: hypothetical protein JXR63_12840 [Spirochaetales bacterium]|nr:hypothetical protein [Spirochaetales bacterium]